VRGLMGVIGVSNEIEVKPTVVPADVKGAIEAALKRNSILDEQPNEGRILAQTTSARARLSSI